MICFFSSVGTRWTAGHELGQREGGVRCWPSTGSWEELGRLTRAGSPQGGHGAGPAHKSLADRSYAPLKSSVSSSSFRALMPVPVVPALLPPASSAGSATHVSLLGRDDRSPIKGPHLEHSHHVDTASFRTARIGEETTVHLCRTCVTECSTKEPACKALVPLRYR